MAWRLAGFGQANDFLPAARRDPTEFAATRVSFERALAMAGVGLDDLDFAEVHDCFTIAELIMYEVMGLTAPGQGRRAIGLFPARSDPVGQVGFGRGQTRALALDAAVDLSQPRAKARLHAIAQYKARHPERHRGAEGGCKRHQQQPPTEPENGAACQRQHCCTRQRKCRHYQIRSKVSTPHRPRRFGIPFCKTRLALLQVGQA